MTDSIRHHVIKYPQARSSTVRYLVARQEMTQKLKDELEAQKRVNEFRDSIGYVSWFRLALSKLRGG